MPTDYSPIDALPMDTGGDTIGIAVLRSLRDALDGKLVTTCTSTTRPTGTARPVGKRIYETNTRQLRIWDGTAWAWVGGAPEIIEVPLPSAAGVTGSVKTFPIAAGSAVAGKSNDPDGVFSIVTTSGSEGIRVRDAGLYGAMMLYNSSSGAPDAMPNLAIAGSSRWGAFAKNGSGTLGEVAFVAAANDLVVPGIYLYTGSVSFTGTLVVRKIAPKW